MIGLMSGAILNIALDPILMFVLHMGVAGAALATAASQVISFLILLSMFLRGRTVTRLSLKQFDPRPRVIGDIMLSLIHI